MADVPAQRTGETTALRHLLDVHRDLIRGGYGELAQVLATGLLDRVQVTDGGSGVIETITTAEAMILGQRVIDAAAPDVRPEIAGILLGL